MTWAVPKFTFLARNTRLRWDAPEEYIRELASYVDKKLKEVFNAVPNVTQDGSCDPPEDVIRRSVNWFLVRLRYVTRAAQVRPLDFALISWRIHYLNDDETELQLDEGLVRGRGAVKFSLGWIALSKTVWEDIHGLPVNYDPPPWDGLLLDALDELPSIGPAVVLALTSLEVFIAHLLDKLAQLKSVDPFLWRWINQRGDWLREPTIEEQFDTLLKFLAGHSLKEDFSVTSKLRL